MKKTILVTGDLVWDTHIARLPWAAKGYHQPHRQTQLLNRHGGAWYLRDVIYDALAAECASANARVATVEKQMKEEAAKPAPDRELIAALEAEAKETAAWAKARKEIFNVTVTGPKKVGHVEIEDAKPGDPGGIAKGFSVWEWYQDEKKSGAWRITEFLGCQSARWERKQESEPELVPCQALVEPAAASPDVLVIDDLGLDFASHEAAWPSCLKSTPAQQPRAIIAKMSAPFDRPLWKNLLSPEWASRVTLVIAAATLRDGGARLGCGFSWDATIEEVRSVFAAGGAGWSMRYCHRVVVTFGRSGAAVFSRHPRSWAEVQSPPDTLRFERFVFDPAHLEKMWSAGFEGTTFGTASLVTARLAVDECLEQKPSSHITVSRGLAAARRLHQLGAGGTKDEFMPRGTNAESVERKALAAAADDRPETRFRSAFDRDLLDAPVLVEPNCVPALEKQTLLTDAVGMTPEFLTVAAAEIVRFGKRIIKPSVPHMEWGGYFTVDRSEIESLNTVRNLILDYRQNLADKRPLSIAVFGQPGSGKSFAIKQLAGALFGKDKAVLEFNLSQFEDIDALHEAFHEVRDKSVQGQLPLVFWDEFDSPLKSGKLGWLKEFLAPMQDAKFFARGREHPFGKCIFIFAGGTCTTFDAFAQSVSENEPDTKSAKGPDFVSRLRGYVNIKGPNPFAAADGDLDHAHIVRRALLLRSLIERHHKGIIQHDNGELVMHPSVLAAFLKAREYQHGARSMEAIVSLSRLRDCRHFGPSELPPHEVVRPHVSEDFLTIVEHTDRIHFSPPQIDQMAAIMHNNWVTQKTASGWSKRHKPGRDATGKTDSRLVAYELLPENEKEANRLPARLTLLRLDKLGFEVRRADSVEPSASLDLKTQTAARHLIAQTEHRRWMREKLLAGAALAPCIDDDLFLHSDLVRFEKLPGSEAKLDYGIAEAIAQFFDEEGLVLVKKVQDPTEASGLGAA